MKNVIKKIAVAAMAFTILGTGSIITDTTSAKSNTLTASAATRYDGHAHGQYTYNSTYQKLVWVQKGVGYAIWVNAPCKRCRACGEIVW